MTNKQYTPMTISEAVAHAEDRSKCGDQCAAEHAQLAAWLRDYQKLLEVDDDLTDLKEANKKLADALDESICMLVTILGSVGFPDEVKESEICDLRDVHTRYAPSAQPEYSSVVIKNAAGRVPRTEIGK